MPAALRNRVPGLDARVLAALELDGPLTIVECATACNEHAPYVASEIGRLCAEKRVAPVDPAATIRHYIAIPLPPN